MRNEVIEQDGGAIVEQPSASPFSKMMAAGGGINAGAVAIESERAIAEAQGQLTLAKRFPRSMAAAITDFLEACNSPEFAETAFYSVPNRGSGPSIRFAEEAARCYGNFVYGHRELSRSNGKSEVEVYAWDMEKNNRSSRQLTVMHVLDTKSGPRTLRDQVDIDNKIANSASRQMRGRILALMPKHMIAAGIEACKRTLAGGGERPISERVVAMAQAFGRHGVSTAHLEAYLGHSVDNTTLDELADLQGVYNAIREGAKASDYFTLGEDSGAGQAKEIAAIAASGKKKQESAAPTKVARKSPAVQKGKQEETKSKQTKESEESKPVEDEETSETLETQEDSPPVTDEQDDEDMF